MQARTRWSNWWSVRAAMGEVARALRASFGVRSWLSADVARSALACVRQVKVDPKDVGMVLKRSVPAIVHTLGRMSQALGRIGANGTMVIRMRVESKLLGGLWLVRARARRGVGKRLKYTITGDF